MWIADVQIYNGRRKCSERTYLIDAFEAAEAEKRLQQAIKEAGGKDATWCKILNMNYLGEVEII